jgi:hypothetical protein
MRLALVYCVGPLKKSFVGDFRVKLFFNFTYAGEDSFMSFDPPTIREKIQISSDQFSAGYQERPCADCEYVLYGRKLSKQEVNPPITKSLPALCIAEMSSIQLKIPFYSSWTTDQISLASLPSQIDSNGVYAFTLMAKIVHDNNDHIARMVYASHYVPVECEFPSIQCVSLAILNSLICFRYYSFKSCRM